MPETVVLPPTGSDSARLPTRQTEHLLRLAEKQPLRTQVVRRITEIQKSQWDAVFPPVLEGYSFFKTLDEISFEPFSFFYVLVYRGETLVGAPTCFLMEYSLDTTVQGILKSLSHAVKKIVPGLFNLRALICGAPMAQGRIGFGEPEKRAEIFDAICGCLERIAEEQRASVIALKDFDREYDSLLKVLSSRGFYRFENMPTTKMKICFESFEAYMKTLGRASRDGLKRKLKKADSLSKLDLEITGEPGRDLDEIYALYLQTVHRHDEFGFEVVPKEFFSRISENMPERTKFFLWRKDGKLVAFAFCLASEDYFIDYYLGFDYSVAHDFHLYFIRFRELLSWCIRNKMKTYEMGPTNYEPKRRLGFGFVPLYVYARCRNPWISPFFKLLCGILKPENFDPVFKWMKERGRET